MTEKRAIRHAMKEWRRQTCVQFSELPPGLNYSRPHLYFKDSRNLRVITLYTQGYSGIVPLLVEGLNSYLGMLEVEALRPGGSTSYSVTATTLLYSGSSTLYSVTATTLLYSGGFR